MSITFKMIKLKIPAIQHYLLLLFAFSLPYGPVINNIITGLIVLLWLLEGDFKRKYHQVKKNPIVIWGTLYVLVNLIALLWSSDIHWGVHMFGKSAKFLLIPLFMTIIEKKYIKQYIFAFVLAMTISEIISYLMWFHLIPLTKMALKEGFPTPFVEHLSYTPFLALAIYFLLYEILFDPKINAIQRLISLFFVFTMSFNLFIGGGRAGQVGFFVILTIITLQYFHKNMIKGIAIMVIAIPAIFTVLYTTVPDFKARVNQGVEDVRHLEDNINTSIGLRINFAFNTIQMIKEHPLLGVGTGDFPTEYARINHLRTPEASETKQPHNMYLTVLAQVGLLGFIPFIMVFYWQIRMALQKTSPYYRMQLMLPLFFLVIMLSDSYLLTHYTMHLFILLSAVLFKNYDDQGETI